MSVANCSAKLSLYARVTLSEQEHRSRDIEGQLREYESLRAGNFELGNLHTVIELPMGLDQGTYCAGLSQKDLVER